MARHFLHRRVSLRSVLSTSRVAGAVAIGLLLSVAPALAVDIPIAPPTAVTPAERQFQLGIAALERNDLATAEKAFLESARLDSGAAAPQMGLAQVALRRGQNDVAETRMKRAVELAPRDAAILTSWGTYLFAKRDLPAAETALRKAVGIDNGVMAAHLHLGDMYLVAFRRVDDAIREYRAAVAADDTFAGARYALGLALLSKGDDKAGELELIEAGKLNPRNPLPPHVLGRLYASRRQLDMALRSFDAALKVFPEFPAAHYEKGQIYAARGDDASALKEYEQVQKNDPRRSIGYTNIGMLHQRNQRWAEAEKAYRSAIGVEPRNSIVYNNLAWLAAERKINPPEALEWAQKAVSLSPNMPEFAVTLGWLYRARGDMPKAEQTLRAAAAIKPQAATALYYLGRVYIERGKVAEGTAEIKKALALQPNFPGADEARRLVSTQGKS